MNKQPLLWWRAVSRSPRGRFGTVLGLTPEVLPTSSRRSARSQPPQNGTLRVESMNNDQSCVSFCVPPWCVDDFDGRLRLSAALAMIDEISTYAGVCVWDRNRRPGVSIQLAAKATCGDGFLDADANERILVRSHRVKVGKTIAFVKCDIENSCGDTIAQCSHIKFLPMGWPLDWCFGPIFGNITIPLVETYIESLPYHDHTIPERIENIFPLREGSNERRHRIAVTEDIGNPVGQIHGGASVMLTCLAAEKLQPKGTRPRWIKTNLINGISCASGEVADVEVENNDNDNDNTCTTFILNRGQVCADTVVEWSGLVNM